MGSTPVPLQNKKIETIRAPGGKRFYDVKSFLEKTDKYDKDNDKIEEGKDERK